MLTLALVLLAACGTPSDVVVDHDNVTIDQSCRVVIPTGVVISDADGDGVIHIAADGITVEFADGSVLTGAGRETPDDALAGVGIRLDGHKQVTIRNARVQGYKCGLRATNADGLVVESMRVDRNFRQRLRSTPHSEDQRDWLRPHMNDRGEWLTRYGAAVCIERSSDVTVNGLVVRSSQNGLILDRVERSRVFDCDCSFLSGWGLAMWRSNDNLISRNALDFCIRGYSHGVYNRGQDSAGILCFEQCSRNQFIENSVTHGGDGLFAFAGREALGEAPAPSDGWDYKGRGCNDNVFFGNDFSDAAAHGVEITFSFANSLIANKLAGNGICGFWGGYSQRTLLADNAIMDNGQPGQREGGGINIEHGFQNAILGNRFARNSIAIALWSDDDGDLLKRPWSKANHRGSADNLIARNSFEDDLAFLRLRETTGTRLELNTFKNTPGEPDADKASVFTVVNTPDDATAAPPPKPPVIAAAVGNGKPVGARADLVGREHIVMGEWGPWDHKTPMMQLASVNSDRRIHAIYGDAGALTIDVLEGQGDLETILGEVEPGLPRTLTLQPRVGIGVLPFAVRVRARDIDQTIRGTLVRSPWTATIFGFEKDPRTDLEGWRAESRAKTAVTVPCDDLGWMRFGGRGPRDLPFLSDVAAGLPGKDRFGVVARTKLTLPKGTWRFTTISDDGVRVTVGELGGKPVIENWTHHGATRDRGTWEQAETGPVDITVEYFQLDGAATLEFAIDRAPGTAGEPSPPATSVP